MGFIYGSLIVSAILFALLGYTRGVETYTDKNNNIKTKMSHGWKMRPRQFLSTLGLVIILFGLVKKVEPNHIGVVFDPFNGGVQTQTLKPGYYIREPWVKIIQMDTKIQKVQYGGMFVITGTDQGYVTVELELQYQVSPQNAGRVFSSYGQIPSSNDLKSFVEMAVNNAAADNTMDQVLGTNINEYKAEAAELLKADLASRGIELVVLNFVDIDGGAQYEAKIQALLAAEQEKELKQKEQEAVAIEEQTKTLQKQEEEKRKSYEVEQENLRLLAQATAQAERNVIEAQAELDAASKQAAALVELANADAQARLERISAYLPENYDSLTDEVVKQSAWDSAVAAYLKQLAYESWNGDVPTTVLDGNGNYIWDLNN